MQSCCTLDGSYYNPDEGTLYLFLNGEPYQFNGFSIGSSKSEIEKIKNDINFLSGTTAALDIVVDVQSEQITNIVEDITDLDERVTRLEEKFNTLEERINKIENDLKK